ncbi:MAG: hypothetical protein A2939_05045 [Parcubacteria group bacterium RIFCSPLOWO2_01_FULL_48_18]|nr:MAG: hypothetical protein A3J67_03480 [Parcubacteria group bacterium RIFCSPHIGHO2_02_FULL_48_10b]OHB22234.1 MAG: hypothetical protein A2939_05045 [Parcubacteria group bacterium RIFCSPLOWO2_01_FULL_48_18]
MAELKIFAGQAGTILSEKVCRELHITPGQARVSRFADGEVDVQFLENVRDSDLFIINSTNPPAENLMEVALLCEAARGSSAGRITLVPTYLGYNRQDRKDRPRVPISARLAARVLSLCGADRVLLLDLHSEPTMGFFDPRIITDHLYASPISIPYLKTLLKGDFVVAAPDKGGGPRAEAYAARLGLGDYVLFTKSRSGTGEIKERSIKLIGDVDGKDVVFVDDMIDTAGTLSADIAAAKEHGARNVYVFATHALFSKDAIERLDRSGAKEIIITDSIYHPPEKLKTEHVKITVLSLAPFLADAISRIHKGESLSPLIMQT